MSGWREREAYEIWRAGDQSWFRIISRSFGLKRYLYEMFGGYQFVVGCLRDYGRPSYKLRSAWDNATLKKLHF